MARDLPWGLKLTRVHIERRWTVVMRVKDEVNVPVNAWSGFLGCNRGICWMGVGNSARLTQVTDAMKLLALYWDRAPESGFPTQHLPILRPY